MKQTKTVAISMKPKAHERLKVLAENEQMSVSAYIEDMVTERYYRSALYKTENEQQEMKDYDKR